MNNDSSNTITKPKHLLPYEHILRIKALSLPAETQLDTLLSPGSAPCDLLDFEQSVPTPAELLQIPRPMMAVYSNMVHVLFERELLQKTEGSQLNDIEGFRKYMELFKSIKDNDYAEGELALNNLQMYEYTNAHDWQVEKWGRGVFTGYYAQRVNPEYFFLAFKSKIGPKPEWLEKHSMEFPLLNFSLTSERPAKQASILYASNGKVIQSSTRSLWTLE